MIATPEPLSPGRLLAGLVTRGFVSPADAIDGVVTLSDLSRSNPVTAVALHGDARFVVKQQGIRVDDVDPLTAERHVYRWLAAVGLAGIAPQLLSEPHDDLVVLEAIDRATSLHHLVVTGSGYAPAAYSSLGTGLGRLHAAGTGAASADTGLVPRRPWILDLATRGLPSIVPATEAVTAIRNRLLERSGVADTLAELAESWSSRTVVHGDVKFDNVLVAIPDDAGSATGLSPGPVRTWLIDWELAGLGDPGWDLAGIVEGTLTAHLLTAGRIDAPSANALVARALEAYADTYAVPEPARLLALTATRVAQASLQLAAMAAEEPGVDARAAEVADLAISIVEEPLAWRTVSGQPVVATA